MEIFANPSTWIVFGVAGIGFFLWWFLYARKHKIINQKFEPGTIKPESCLVFDTILHQWYQQILSAAEVTGVIARCGTMGRKWNFEGKWVYEVVKKKLTDEQTGKTETVYTNVPQTKEYKDSPRGFFNDMEFPEVDILLSSEEEKPWMEKYGKLLVWLGSMAVCITLIVLNR